MVKKCNMLSSDFVDACLYLRVAAAQLLEMAPLELKEIIQESDATGSPYLINEPARQDVLSPAQARLCAYAPARRCVA